MEITTIADELDDLRSEDEEIEDSFMILSAKIGQTAEALVRVKDLTDDDLEEIGIDREDVDAAIRDVVGGVIVASVTLGEEYDVDVNKAVEERIELMKHSQQFREQMREAQDGADDPVDTELDAEDDKAFF